MKYVKFTYIDRLTGKSVAVEPAANGPVFPSIPGLEFEWARESQYPTNVPEFFGTCPDNSNTQIDGVLGIFLQSDWEQMRTDEMAARNPVPPSVTMRQARLALLGIGLLDDVEAAIAALPSPQKEAATIQWEYSQEVQRSNGLVASLAPALGMTESQIDALFFAAAQL